MLIPITNLMFTFEIIIHSKYFPDSDWLKARRAQVILNEIPSTLTMLDVILYAVGTLLLVCVAFVFIFGVFLVHKRRQFSHIPSPPIAR